MNSLFDDMKVLVLFFFGNYVHVYITAISSYGECLFNVPWCLFQQKFTVQVYWTTDHPCYFHYLIKIYLAESGLLTAFCI